MDSDENVWSDSESAGVAPATAQKRGRETEADSGDLASTRRSDHGPQKKPRMGTAREVRSKGRPAHVIAFSRDGAVFTVTPTASLSEAARIVYAAAGSSHCRDGEALALRISNILRTRDGADDKVYLHPVDDDGDAVVRYMVMYASRAAPVDASDAVRMWEEYAERQRDETARKGDQPHSTVKARPARVIAFSCDGAVFTVTPTASLKEAARIVYDAAGSSHYRDGAALTSRIANILRTRDGADDKVYLHPVDDDGDAVVRYMVMYASRAAPVDASDAARMWEEYDGRQRNEASRVGDGPQSNARPARVIAFSCDGAVFTVTPTASLSEAARIVYAAAGSTHCRDGEAIALRISSILRTRDGADDKVYLHPVDDDGDAVVRYLVMYASRAAPVDVSDAARMWEEYAGRQMDETARKGDEPQSNARPARVVAFTRDGAVFTVTPTASLKEAGRIVYAAAGSSYYRDGEALTSRIASILRTRDGADDKVYLHPVDDDGDAVVRYMVMYASRAAPVDASDAVRMWEEYAGRQMDETARKGDQPQPNARPARVIAFSRDGAVFTITPTASLTDAARIVYAAGGSTHGRNGAALAARINGILRTRDGADDKVYLHPVDDDGDAVVRYMVMYASRAAPVDASDAVRMWNT